MIYQILSHRDCIGLYLVLLAITTISAFLLYRQKTKAPWSGSPLSSTPPFCFHQSLSNKSGVYGARIGLDLKDGCFFTIRREQWYDRAFKTIGLSREFQLGMADFDESFYIISDSNEFHTFLQHDTATISTIRKIFGNDDDVTPLKIQCAGKRLWIEYKCKNSDSPTIKRDGLSSLSALESALEEKISMIDARHDNSAKRAAILTSVGGGLFIAALTAFFADALMSVPYFTDSSRLLAFAIKDGIIAGLLIALCAALSLRKTSQAHLVLGSLLLTLPVSLSALTYTVTYQLDTDLDNSSVRMYTVKVLEKYRTTGKHAHNVLGVTDWESNSNEKTLSSPGRIYNQVNVGDTVTVYERSGYFGYHWVERFERGEKSNW